MARASNLPDTLARVFAAGATAAVMGLRGAALGLLLIPLALLVWLSFAHERYLVLPPQSYSFRWYVNAFEQPGFVTGLLLSLQIAVIVTCITLVMGVLAAYGQWRFKVAPGRSLETLLSLPLLIPSVVTATALVILANQLGSYNAFLNIVIGHAIVSLPFAYRAVAVALARYDRAQDEAAGGLGASPVKVFWHVTLPQLRSGILAGGLFSFIISFDDFAITIFLIDANTVPLPVAMYHYMEWNQDPTLSAVSAVLIAASVVVTLVIHRLIGLDRFLGLR
jgi:putative spermidine/putrescine transport system permease protein